MIISVTALAWLVSIATLVTALAPLVLLAFWLNDLLRRRLW
jgi:hypothetical protein